jgi:hypothetical protein
MRLFLLFAVAATMTWAADAPAKKVPPAKKVAEPAPALQIPPGAVESEPGNFHFTDSAGKKWIYRKTPFGVARVEDKGPEPAAEAAAQIPQDLKGATAREDGDVVRFERPGPFGTYKWERKKSELTDTERSLLERQKNGAGKQD